MSVTTSGMASRRRKKPGTLVKPMDLATLQQAVQDRVDKKHHKKGDPLSVDVFTKFLTSSADGHDGLQTDSDPASLASGIQLQTGTQFVDQIVCLRVLVPAAQAGSVTVTCAPIEAIRCPGTVGVLATKTTPALIAVACGYACVAFPTSGARFSRLHAFNAIHVSVARTPRYIAQFAPEALCVLHGVCVSRFVVN